MRENPALAGAWTQEKGDLQFISTTRYYQTGVRFDNNGNRLPQPHYRQAETNPYLEYGLTPDLTLGANLFLQAADNSTARNAAIGDSEFFANYQLWRDDTYALALQPLVKIPAHYGTPKDPRAPKLGSANPDFGLSLLGGMNFDLFGRKHFAEIDAGYRYRFGAPQDQLRFTLTGGLSLNDELTLMPQLFQTLRLGGFTATGFSMSPRDDYNLTTGQLSLIYALHDGNQVQLGGFYHVAGQNTGDGGGILLGWWKSF